MTPALTYGHLDSNVCESTWSNAKKSLKDDKITLVISYWLSHTPRRSMNRVLSEEGL